MSERKILEEAKTFTEDVATDRKQPAEETEVNALGANLICSP